MAEVQVRERAGAGDRRIHGSQGSRTGFGAILGGFYRDGDLRYAGKVGTGFDHQTLRNLRERFEQLSRRTPPFSEDPREKDAHWVSPELVATVGFTEWTEDDKLRHPRFRGLRRDKDPRDVWKEVPS
jgi:bifunctional non-homologous end joining protein LigD